MSQSVAPCIPLPHLAFTQGLHAVQARIHPYFPYFHVDVLADCVLFKPAAGHILGMQLGNKATTVSYGSCAEVFAIY